MTDQLRITRRRLLTGAAVTAGAVALSPRAAFADHGSNLPYGGINTHFTYTNERAYADRATAVRAVRALQTKLCRDGINPRASANQKTAFFDQCRQTGAQFLMVCDADLEGSLDLYEPLIRERIVVALEPVNEPLHNGYSVGFVRDYQRRLYEQVHARFPGVQVLSPALGNSESQRVGSLESYVDIGNTHYYATETSLDPYVLDRNLRLQSQVWGRRPFISGESNYLPQDDTPHNDPAWERKQADVFRRLAQELAKRGCHRVMCYSLVNEVRKLRTNFGSPIRELGAFREDWAAKPLAYAVRDLNRRS